MTEFKPLEFTEIDIVLGMMQEFYAIDNYPIDLEKSRKLFHYFISDEKLGKAFVVYNDNQIVGYFILTYIFSFEYQGIVTFIDELYLKSTHRGKGLGNKTVVFAQEFCRNKGDKMMYLEVEPHNKNAQKLYLANHFEEHNRNILKHKLY